jgi:hypothetical protein
MLTSRSSGVASEEVNKLMKVLRKKLMGEEHYIRIIIIAGVGRKPYIS